MERRSPQDADRVGPRIRHVALYRSARHSGLLPLAMNLPILTLLVALPLVGGVLTLLVGRGRDGLVRQLALGVSLLTFAASLAMWARFDAGSADLQFVERYTWLPEFGISYHVGIDGISLMLVLLTTFLTPISLLCSWESIEDRVREFSFFMLVLEAAMIG